MAQREYSDRPARGPEQVQGGTTRVVDGALVITVDRANDGVFKTWPLPETSRASVTASMGAPAGAEAPRGFWYVVIGDRDQNTGVMLTCWADGTPPELVDLRTREVLLVMRDGECDGPSEMELAIDNPDDTDGSMITAAAGGSETTAFLSGERYEPRDAGYGASSEDPGFSVELTRVLVVAG